MTPFATDFPTRSGTKRIIRITIIALAALLVVGYGYYTSRSLIEGPEILITDPVDGSSFSSSTIKITGVAERIKEMSMNGRIITIDESGNFSEYVILFPGYNIVSFVGKDQFGRSTEKKMQFLLKL